MACFAAPRPGELLGVLIDGTVYSATHPVTVAVVALVRAGQKWVKSVLARYHGLEARRRVSRHCPEDVSAGGVILRLRYHIDGAEEGGAFAIPLVVARRGSESYTAQPLKMVTCEFPSIRIGSAPLQR